MRRYLLGQLDGAEREAVEERLFAEREFLAQVEAAEEDLIDEDAAGTMPWGDREAWAAYKAARPEVEQRLPFARALQRKRVPARMPWWQWAAPVGAMALVLLMMVPHDPQVFSVVLTQGTLRSGTEQAQVVRIPAGTAVVRMDFQMPGAVRAEVKFVDTGEVLWKGPVVKGIAEVPEGVLRPGDCVVALFDRPGNDVADYSFRVSGNTSTLQIRK